MSREDGKVKFGITGIGNMGSAHVGFINAVANAELTAVCDINKDAFKRIDEKTRSRIGTYTSSEEFFAKADADAVIIAVPHYSHPDLAITAMGCGKHVIVENPIAVHKAEAERLIKEAENYPSEVISKVFNSAG